MNITSEMIERAIEMSKANMEIEDDIALTKNDIENTKKKLLKQFNLRGNINGQQLGQVCNRRN